MEKFLTTAVAVHSLAAVPWWIAIIADPSFRRWFLPAVVPDGALLAFAVPDVVLFSGAGLAAAYGLRNHRGWACDVLLLHTGAACYAALYTWQQAIQANQAWPAAVAMLPSLILLPYASWWFRTRQRLPVKT